MVYGVLRLTIIFCYLWGREFGAFYASDAILAMQCAASVVFIAAAISSLRRPSNRWRFCVIASVILLTIGDVCWTWLVIRGAVGPWFKLLIAAQELIKLVFPVVLAVLLLRPPISAMYHLSIADRSVRT
jgi:hypothetical protein